MGEGVWHFGKLVGSFDPDVKLLLHPWLLPIYTPHPYSHVAVSWDILEVYVYKVTPFSSKVVGPCNRYIFIGIEIYTHFYLLEIEANNLYMFLLSL